MRRQGTDFYEREYNARAAIPEHPLIFARWAQQAALARRAQAALIDLAYGDGGGERLDLFPARGESAPLLVFIHGGYWRSLDKRDFSWLAPPFVARGVAVALLNYGLAPATPIEEIVRQVLRALAWLHQRGDRYGFDPQRIFVCGHSAGAHLTAMAMAAQWTVFDRRLPADLVKGGLAISGLYDLEPLLHAPFVNVDLQLTPARAARLSPLRLPAATDAPLCLAVGALESSEFRRQTRAMARHWPHQVARELVLAGCNHLTVCDELGRAGSDLYAAALDLVRGRLRRT